jgi:hypothetical protein
VAARRACLGPPADGQLPDRPGRDPARARRARRGRRPARLSQRLPPPRIAAAERIGAVQGGDSLPVSRVDLPARRQPDRRPRGAGLRIEARQAGARSAAGARRGDVRPGVRQPRCRRHAAGRARRRPPPAAGALPDRHPRVVRRVGRQPPAGELEGRCRQLPRGLPHTDRPSGPDADARLQALRRRGQRALRVVRVPPARQALEQSARAAVRPDGYADGGAGARRSARVALRLHLSQHDDRPVSRPGEHLADAARRGRIDERHVGQLPRARRRPAHPAGAVGQPAPEHARLRRGHRPRRQRPTGAADARLSVRATRRPRGRAGSEPAGERRR